MKNAFIAAFAASLLCTACARVAVAPEYGTNASSSAASYAASERYENTEYGIAFRYPLGWLHEEWKEDDVLTAQFTSPTASANNSNMPRITLTAANLHGETVKSYDDMEKILLKQPSIAEKFTLIHSSDAAVKSVPARMLVFAGEDYKKDPMTMRAAIFAANDHLYVIMLAALDSYGQISEDAFEAVLSRVEFL